jgi:hypothetical protein
LGGNGRWEKALANAGGVGGGGSDSQARIAAAARPSQTREVAIER